MNIKKISLNYAEAMIKKFRSENRPCSTTKIKMILEEVEKDHGKTILDETKKRMGIK